MRRREFIVGLAILGNVGHASASRPDSHCRACPDHDLHRGAASRPDQRALGH